MCDLNDFGKLKARNDGRAVGALFVDPLVALVRWVSLAPLLSRSIEADFWDPCT